MDNLPRQKLKEIMTQQGPELAIDHRRTRALLMDLCGNNRLEVNLLVSAQEEKIPTALLAQSGKAPRTGLLNRLVRNLQEFRGMTPEAAAWAVESWAFALNIQVPPAWQKSRRKPSSPSSTDPTKTNSASSSDADQTGQRPFFGSNPSSLPFQVSSTRQPGGSTGSSQPRQSSKSSGRGSSPPSKPAHQSSSAHTPQPGPPPLQQHPRSHHSSAGRSPNSSSFQPPTGSPGWQSSSPPAWNPAPASPTPGSFPPNSQNEFTVSQWGQTPYHSIHDALQKARPGARIKVQPGIYREDLLISFPVELVGDGPADQVIVEGEPAILIVSEQAILRNLTLRSTSAFLPAVKVGAGPALIENCHFAASFQPGAIHPAVERRCRGLTARGSNIEALVRTCRAVPLLDPDSREPAAVVTLEFELDGHSRVIVDGGSYGEVRVTGSSPATFKDVDILALNISGAGAEPQLQDCRMSQVNLSSGASPTFVHCRIQGENSPLGGAAGVRVQGKSVPRFENCELSGSCWGLLACDGARPTLKGCQIRAVGHTTNLLLQSSGAGFLPQPPGAPILPSASTAGTHLPAAVRLQEEARAVLNGCRLSGAGIGLDLDSDSWVEARNCQISGNTSWGVWAHVHSGGQIEFSDLTGNGVGAVKVEPNSHLNLIGNKE